MESKKEKLLDKTYDNYLQLILYDFPIEKINELVVDDVKGYGTTKDEKFPDINRLRKMVLDQREQGAGIEMKFQHTPIHRRISDKEDVAIYIDEFLLTMEAKEEKNTIPLRLTSVFEFNKNKWKLVHLHGSQAVETENDTWHQDVWKRKNEELQKQVNEKTAELLIQNHELEIETALERVRTVTMSMQKPDDLLDVCKTISEQLETLNVKNIRNVQVAIIDESKKNYLNYQFFTPYSEKVFEITEYENHPTSQAMVDELQKSANSFFTGELKGDNLVGFRKWRKRYNQFPDPLSEKSDVIYYYFYSIGKGGLGLTTYQKISSKSLEIFKRFHKVFTLAYRRFKDIRQAEAQAREAQIQLGLERVRARAMAMHKSEQLAETAKVLFEQFDLLGKIPDRMSIGIVNEETGNFELWVTDQKGETTDHAFLFRLDESVAAKIYKAWKKKKDTIIVDLTGQELKDWIQYLIKEVKLPINAANIKNRRVQQAALFSHGFLLLTSHQPVAEEIMKLLVRFAGVFDLTYTRFLDLQNAEAQARESQIQLALERVRARTMAMQSSEELAEVSYLLNKQVVELGIPTRGCAFNIYNEHDSTEWFSSLEGTIPTYKTPRKNFFLKYYEAGQRGETLLIEEYGGERIKKHYKYLATLSTTENSEETIEEDVQVVPEFQIDHVAYFKYGYLLFITLVPAPEAHDIFKRFAKEFEQTYTRFLDLQKAEAQAKEARIEASLERLRSRTMGMQHSDELRQVVAVLYEEMGKLDFDIRQFALSLLDKKSGTVEWWGTGFDETILPASYVIHYREKKLKDNPFVKGFIDGVDQQIPFQVQEYKGKKKKQFDDLTFNHTSLKDLPEKVKQEMRKVPHLFMSNAFMKYGVLEVIGQSPVDEEKSEILQRFAKVFEQTYTRFLDLQKAEAQAREAQIEAAMEKIRSRSLAMRSSNELQDLVNTVFDQLMTLHIDMNSASIFIFEKGSKAWQQWVAAPETSYAKYFHIPYSNQQIVKDLEKERQKGNDFFSVKYSYEEKNKWFDYAFKHTDYRNIPEKRKKYIRNGECMIISFALSKNTGIQITKYHGKKFSEKENEIVKRIAKVFEQAYVRFLDLQKAEAQARESEIQLALERVRARTMAMHKSDELAETAAILFKQMKKLGVTPERINICLIKEADNILEVWATDQEGIKISHHFNASLDEPTTGKRVYGAWKEKKKSIIIDLSGKELNDWIRYVREVMGMTIKAELVKEHRIHSVAFFSQGMIITTTPELLPEESIKLLERFADVFNLTYTRFLDLKKAEAQSRESEIQLALERVRARTMAMQKSEELAETMFLLSEQLKSLGEEIDQVTIGIFDEEKGIIETSVSIKGNQFKTKPVPIDEPFVMGKFYQAWRRNEKSLIVEIKDEELQKYNKWRNKFLGKKIYPTDQKVRQWIVNAAIFSKGLLSFSDEKQASTETLQLLKRFAAVFDLTYTRFLDLKKAEAQARESQIEAALERVRSKAMAMRNSDDLAATVDTFFSELYALNVTPHRCGMGIIDRKTRVVDIQSTTSTNKNKRKIITGQLTLAGHPVLDNIYKNWKLQKEYHPVLQGNEILEYYEAMNPEIKFPAFAEDETQYGYYFFFKEGGVYAWTNKQLGENDLQIFRRYTSVLSLTYRRYMDLKDAEAQARETVKQASLDRVRGEIASMRTSEDLNRITPVIWNELQALEVPFIRCGVFIVENEKKKVHVYLNTPDGNALGVLNLSFNANELTKNTVDHWRKKQVYTEHWNKEEFVNWTKSMMELGQVQNAKTYQGSPAAPESLNLHFVPFSQGMLYVGDVSPLSEEKLELVKTLAEAFSVAYARYEDFKNLEEAKDKIESTLNELKAAQTQLVQAEKMASLGELTAGIAHEIQNPLNFVNNFSEVSTELLEELKEEIEKGNYDEVKALTNDVIQNLEKILHHGKRADGIVKSMLQHSRGSSGQKEMVDINALADEYLRLSFHGLRAKNKSFNADFKLETDNSLPRINVVPQDIGRVLLNLINNAFYAVSEKTKQNLQGYKPLVTVGTQKMNNKIKISVEDNGTGIPESVKDKIFQPFFTTKPTGEGTGLGLSLSYDIIKKGHKGDLSIESKEGKGTKFIITLPI